MALREKWAKLYGARFCITTSSGTAAIHTAVGGAKSLTSDPLHSTQATRNNQVSLSNYEAGATESTGVRPGRPVVAQARRSQGKSARSRGSASSAAAAIFASLKPANAVASVVE